MSRVFISYRREDSAFETTAIHEKLCEQLGSQNVFMDVDAIPAGQDFRKYIRAAVHECDVLIAMIGDKWLSAKNEDGCRRLESPLDFVRIEIEAALERDIPVIPLLIGATPMPKLDQVPDSLSKLVYRHALTVRPGRDFRRDMDELTRQISRTIEYQSKQSSQVKPAIETITPKQLTPQFSRKTKAVEGRTKNVRDQGRQASPRVSAATGHTSPIIRISVGLMAKVLLAGYLAGLFPNLFICMSINTIWMPAIAMFIMPLFFSFLTAVFSVWQCLISLFVEREWLSGLVHRQQYAAGIVLGLLESFWGPSAILVPTIADNLKQSAVIWITFLVSCMALRTTLLVRRELRRWVALIFGVIVGATCAIVGIGIASLIPQHYPALWRNEIAMMFIAITSLTAYYGFVVTHNANLLKGAVREIKRSGT